MTASLHKLSAGDGYTYLTKQVAALDHTDLGRQGLSAYYAEKGESPGRWMGQGLAGLAVAGDSFAVAVGSVVDEAQMMALFGSGRHPEADRIEAAALQGGASKDAALRLSQLGRVFQDGSTGEFQRQLAAEYRGWNEERSLPSRAEIPEDVRAGIRTQLALKTFVKKHGREPLTTQEFDGHLKREMRGDGSRSCAGYDLTFSPVKSISTLWAVAPREVAEVIEAAQAEAVAEAVGWLESEMTFTRRGMRGVRQVETRGLLAAAFVHRDSRAGDPDLHTHVAISNKVQAAEDGAWLALDGREIFQATVAVSERYNSSMERILARELGVEFVERESDSGRRGIREIAGVSSELMGEWSKRRSSITARQAELVAEFEAQHHRPPTPVETLALAQRATLDTRAEKHEPRSLEEQRTQWRQEAERVLGGGARVDEMTRGAIGRGRETVSMSEALVAQLAVDVVRTVEGDRASFHRQHVLAEAERQARTAGVDHADYRVLVEQVTARVLQEAVPIGVEHQEPENVPVELQRSDGTSQYRRVHAQRYTTSRVLEAEQLIKAAAKTSGGAVIPQSSVDLALLEATANGVELNPAQARLVSEFVTSPARVRLALAPAGTGKTTAMGVMASAWRDAGGNVVAVAPTHVAADSLKESMRAEGGTIASLSWALETGSPLPAWAAALDAASLVVVDEAGMAGTFDLAKLVEFTLSRGASVRLVGDNQQLAAVAAGGVLRDLAQDDAVDVVSLDEAMRFVDKAEGRATLALRTGDVEALGFYADRDRLHSVAETSAEHVVFEAWKSDRARGWESLMLAASNEQVSALNAMARRDLVAAGVVVDGQVVQLRDGNQAGVGDRIVTRSNDRRLSVSATDWVKNRDRWEVLDVTSGGDLVVKGDRHQQVVTLPADYVAAHVELGYASTVHSAQGMTVDSSHTILSGDESRQTLYVAMSRGRHENHAWVTTGAAEESERWLSTTQPPTPTEVLEGVLRRDGQAVSATGQVTLAADPTHRLAHDALVWQDSRAELLATNLPVEDRARIEAHLQGVVTGADRSGAYAELTAQLFTLQLQGKDAVALFDAELAANPVEDARNVAAVMSWRMQRLVPSSQGPLPWLPGLPEGLQVNDQWQAHLAARAQRISETTEQVRAGVDGWVQDPDTAPRWSKPFLQDPRLVQDLAVWRASFDVPETDLAPMGTASVFAAAGQWRDQLNDRVDQATGPQTSALRVPDPVAGDPYWQVVRRRLDAYAQAGHPVEAAVDDAVQAGPLPVEHPAAALWYRVESRLIEGQDALSTSGQLPEVPNDPYRSPKRPRQVVVDQARAALDRANQLAVNPTHERPRQAEESTHERGHSREV